MQDWKNENADWPDVLRVLAQYGVAILLGCLVAYLAFGCAGCAAPGTDDVYTMAGAAIFLSGWWLGRYSRDLYWTSKAWPSPHPTQACARGRLFWVAADDSPEDCERLLTLLEADEKVRAVRARKPWIGSATVFCLALLGCGDRDEPAEAWCVAIGEAVVVDDCARPEPPLYVHLCDAMPAVDRDAWGAAAEAINEGRAEPPLWVGNGPPIGCNTVDVCPDAALAVVATLRIGDCTTEIRYQRGAAAEVATRTLADLLAPPPEGSP